MKKKIIVIFSGYNQRAVVAFLRTLEKHKVNYAIIASSKDDDIFLTKYKENIFAVRGKKELALNDILACLQEVYKKKSCEQLIIAPSTEALNRFLLENKEIFEKHDCKIPLVGSKLYEEVSDKYKFNHLCIENGILVPEEYDDFSHAKLPFVAKPKSYFTSDGFNYPPVLVFNNKEKELFAKKYNIDDFYYQEFVGGDSFYLLYYFFKDGSLMKLSQQNYLQQPEGKSIVAAVSSDYHLEEESLKYERMFQRISFSGLVMVEIKKNKRKHYMIEANPRFWGPSQLFVDAGVNFFEAFLYDQGFLQEKPNGKDAKKETRYFWSGGLSQVLKEGKEIVCYGPLSKDIIKNVSDWVSVDIYNREDTKEIFKRDNNEIV